MNRSIMRLGGRLRRCASLAGLCGVLFTSALNTVQAIVGATETWIVQAKNDPIAVTVGDICHLFLAG